MSEFGNETATATMRTVGQGFETLIKLLKFLSERTERKINKEYKKEQLVQIKNERGKKEATEFLNNTRGYVKMKQLLKSGERLLPITTPLSPEDLKRFNRLAKLEGVTYAAIKNKTKLDEYKEVKRELSEIDKQGLLTEEQSLRREKLSERLRTLEKGREQSLIIIREKDLELVKDITDRMNMEIQFSDINEEIKELSSKKNLTQEEQKRLEELLKEKEDLLGREFKSFNDKNNETIFKNAIDGETNEIVSFERAISRVMEREYSQEPCYMCERTNPDNYMEVISTPQEHEGRVFTNTEFKVYNNGIAQRCDEFSHGKFTHYSRKDGENSTIYGNEHWQNMKAEIKEKGGFSDDIIIFSNEGEYRKYRDEFKKTQENIKPEEKIISYEADSNSYKDYMGVVNILKGQLQDQNFEVNEQRQICRADSNEFIHPDTIKDDEKIKYAEAINLGKQIDAYVVANEKQTQLAFIRQQQEMNEKNFIEQGKPEGLKGMYEQMRENLHKQEYDLCNDIAVQESKISTLQHEREQITGVKIAQMAQNNQSEEKKLATRNKQDDFNEFRSEEEEKVNSHEEEHTQTKEKWDMDTSKANMTNIGKTNEKLNIKNHERE